MRVDVAILGGGCAGLALARELARRAPALRTVVLERRERYREDRTWCFWAPAQEHPLSRLVCRRWRAWRFSTAQTSAVHRPQRRDLRYQCVRALDFYDDARSAIARSANSTLHLGTTVDGIVAGKSEAKVYSAAGTLHAGWVVDTRPPAPLRQPGIMRQVFTGREVVTEQAVFEPDTVGLMQHMSVDDHGFRFTYVLPFSDRHALVEETRFTDTSPPLSRLEADLARTLTTLGADGGRTLRTESGSIPMCTTLAGSGQAGGAVVVAGTAGGAVRPSSGYAFQRIDSWARRCAALLAAGAAPIPHPPDPAWRRTADAFFLRVLQRRPETAPSAFQAMGARLAPETFVRFMSDRGGPGDLARMAAVLPKRPFIAELGAFATRTGIPWPERS